MTDKSKQEILLESGTNEMEIIEFFLGDQSFGINVQKLREIIRYEPENTVEIPDSPPSVVGTLLLRGNLISLIDLNIHLRRNPSVDRTPSGERRVVLVCEFNKRITGFLVDGVNQIHRLSWKKVSPLSDFISQFRPRFTGSVNIEDREILIVDLEHILAEVDPETALRYEEEQPPETTNSGETSKKHQRSRGEIRLMIAEDSAVIREGLLNVLKTGGYNQVVTFVDGEKCLEAITRLKQEAEANHGGNMTGMLDLLISDIEMPGMDGLTLCRKIREDLGLKDLPILIFSSMINDQMVHKCDSVGATGCVSKPQIATLIQMIDGYCLR